MLRERIVVLGLVMIALQLVLRGWVLSRTWFFMDDLSFISRALNDPLDLHYFFESYAGHLMPAGFAVVKVLTILGVYDWSLWAAVLLGMQAVVSLGMLRLLRQLFGSRPAVLVLLALFLASAIPVPAGVWFAAGINQLPLQIALVFGLHAHVHYLRTRRRAALVQTLLWSVVGLAFYEKSVLLIGIYWIVALFWFTRGRLRDRLRQLWRWYRPALLAHAALAVAYLGCYVLVALNFAPADATRTSWLGILKRLLGESLVPALVGGPVTWDEHVIPAHVAPPPALQFLGWSAFILVVGYAQLTRTRSLRAWTLPAFTIGVNTVLIAAARASVVGPDVALDFRYQSESAAVMVLALGLAYLPPRGAREPNGLRPLRPRRLDNPRLVTLVTTVVVATSLASNLTYAQALHRENPTPAFFRTLEASLAVARAEGRTPVPVVDRSLPKNLMWGYRHPENMDSHVLRPFSRDLDYVQVSNDNLYILDHSGQLVAAEIPRIRSIDPAKGTSCLTQGADGSIVLPLSGPVFGAGWWVRFSYHATESTPALISAGTARHEITMSPGLHSLFFTVAGQFSTIEVSGLRQGADVCIADLALGQPTPLGTTS